MGQIANGQPRCSRKLEVGNRDRLSHRGLFPRLQIQKTIVFSHDLKGTTLIHVMNRFRDETAEICKQKGWDKAPISAVWMLYTEESGELASAIRQHQRMYKKTGLKKDRGVDIKMEMGDVFSYLFQLAHMLEIDLDGMWDLHRKKVQNKVYFKNNIGVY